MDEGQILARVREVISQVVGRDVPITPDSRVRSDLGLDSLEAVIVLLQLEREFGVRLDDDSLYLARTVQDVVNLIGSALQGGQTSAQS